MMPRNPDNARVSTTLRLPAELLDRLDAEAEARVLGRTKLVELLLRSGLDSLPPVDGETG